MSMETVRASRQSLETLLAALSHAYLGPASSLAYDQLRRDLEAPDQPGTSSGADPLRCPFCGAVKDEPAFPTCRLAACINRLGATDA